MRTCAFICFLAVAAVGGAQAAGLSVDFGLEGSGVQPGFEDFTVPQTNGWDEVIARTFGAYTVTLTPSFDNTGGTYPASTARLCSKNRNGAMADPASPLDLALFDYIRGETDVTNIRQGEGASEQLPVIQIDIAGLAPGTYECRAGAYDVWGSPECHQILRAGGDTTGPDVSIQSVGAVQPVNMYDYSGAGRYTIGDSGLLSLEMAFDNSDFGEADPQAVIDYLIVIPEPATLSLLALGGLVALRRRR